MNTLLSVSIALLAGLLMTRLFKPFKLPDVTAYLIAGVLIGPYCIGALGIGGLGFPTMDAFVVCVSEETGNVSYAVGGNITRAVSREQLREQLIQLQGRIEKENRMFTLKKGRRGNEGQIEK